YRGCCRRDYGRTRARGRPRVAVARGRARRVAEPRRPRDRDPPCAAEPWARQLAGDWEGAAAAWHAVGCPYEEALALAEVDDATAIQRAFEVLTRLGAAPAAALAARRLRDRGVRVARGPRAMTRASVGGLTERETDVVRLVAEGLRNSEIAQRLFLSPRTVDHHVSAVLRKLDARTRLEAAS